jgi:hypothetical protein
MFKKSLSYCIVALTAVCLFSYPTAVSAANSSDPTLLVVPSHYTIVQLAFDIAKLRRNILIVSFSNAGVKTGQSLYAWDGNIAEWTKTTFADYASGELFKVKPGKVIIMGSEKDVPAVLAQTAWCSDIKRIPSLDILGLVNSMNEDFRFTTLEWRWLAKEYDLKIQDLNAERRRYGKYGKPGEKQVIPMPNQPEAKADKSNNNHQDAESLGA